MLELLFDSEEQWRSGPPPAYAFDLTQEAVPKPVQEYFQARFLEVAGRLNDPECRLAIVERAWRELVNS
jgi:hypothetical protein